MSHLRTRGHWSEGIIVGRDVLPSFLYLQANKTKEVARHSPHEASLYA